MSPINFSFSSNHPSDPNRPLISPLEALVDLVLFLSVMFLVRTIHFESWGFWGNALFKSIVTVGSATCLLYYRGQSWKDLGLTRPEGYLKMLVVVAITLIGTVATIMIFEVFVRELLFGVEEVQTKTGASRAFEQIGENLPYLFFVLTAVWLESFLEELQDRGFSLTRFEGLLSKIPFSTVFAVLLQAAIFGFRHSYDFSPRSMTTGLIGLVIGVVYVVSGRNLWPLILAHCFLNTMSMVDNL